MNKRRTRLRICLCALALLAAGRTSVHAQEYRGIWVDAFGEGYRNSSQVDSLVSRAVAGRYNAIFAEVLAYHDYNGTSSHGAFWNSSIVPKAGGLGSFDPLAYLVQKAHASNLYVFAWIVPFRASNVWPPGNNAILTAHPEWCMVPEGSMGGGPDLVTDFYALDPGSPGVQEYLMSIVRELVTNYAIDGLQWDYIRYVQIDCGYPADMSYANSGLERFKRITGYVGTPPSTGNTSWDDFRRRTITEVVRRSRAEIQAITSNPRQPVRNTAAVITLGNAPATFTSSGAWARFQNWEEWMRMGFLDVAIPMNYDRDWDPNEYNYFRNWVTQELTWRYNRHLMVGTALYLNSFANSKDQMLYARGAGANGLASYDYVTTCNSGCYNWDWYPYVAANIFTAASSVPTMPWRSSATATEGTLWGRVLDGSGQPVDDASVGLARTSLNAKTDPNGYYVITLVNAGASGSSYSATAQKAGIGTQTASITVTRAGLTRKDFTIGAAPPTITQQPAATSVCAGGTAQFTIAATGDAPISYQWQKSNANLSNGGHYSGVTTTTLTVTGVDVNDVADYRCVVTNPNGNSTSNQAALSLKAATSITQHPAATSACAGGAAQFTVAATGDGTLGYQWQKNNTNLSNGGHYSGVTTATLAITAADASDLANYRCVVTGGCDTATSNNAALSFKAPTAITQDPVNQAVCPGATVQFSVTATGDGTLAYQWQQDGVYLNNRGHYSGVNTATLTITGADASDAANYRCIVTGACGSATSGAAALAMNGSVSIVAQPQSQTVASGSPASFAVSATGGETYQWQKNGVNVSNDGHYSGATSNTLGIDATTEDDAGQYRCVVNGACDIATSDPGTLTITVPADLDRDGDVDGGDFGILAGCFNGTGNPITGDCDVADLNDDSSVDGIDFGLFSGCFNGTGNPPSC